MAKKVYVKMVIPYAHVDVFEKSTFSILFSVLSTFKSQTKHLSFLTFSWDKEECKLKTTVFLGGRSNPLPPLVPLGADRSFIIGTEMV